MMQKTFGSLFSGGGGADMGAKAAGLELAWGNELLPEIAEVGNFNLGQHIRVGDVLEQCPKTYERVDILHMSPPCTRASMANASAEVNEDGSKESPLDIALANKCIEFIEALQPEVVTLENVFGYRKFHSWKGGRKCEGIQSALYRLGYWVSVEHVNAADYGVPQTRKRMIVRAIRGGWVPYLRQPVPWIGWYAAIEDILHTLPDSQFAPWQIARLEPGLRSMLDNCRIEKSEGYSDESISIKGDDPAFTVTGESNGRVKAFIVDGQNARNFGNGPTTLPAESPVFTIGASQAKGMPRALTGDRVVTMTPRCLARFQSFPDSYRLPGSSTLAAKILGNAVPPLLYQEIVGQLMGINNANEA